MEKTAFLFAGQGAQYAGMGRDLCESYPAAKEIFERADKKLGFGLSSICFDGPQQELTRTDNAQPAILTMSIACLEAFKQSPGFGGISVGFNAGLSLGEYSALVSAGSLSFEDALYLVRRRGQFMEEAAASNPGKMLSIIGLDLEKVKDICRNTGSEVANLNCPGQTVISAGPEAISQAKAQAEAAGCRMALILEVSGAFHSSLMSGASVKLAKELKAIKIDKPKTPVISNVSARPCLDSEEIRENLVRQVASSVLWEDSMRYILSQSVSKFYEFGPGKVLKGLMRRIEPKASVLNIEKGTDLGGA